MEWTRLVETLLLPPAGLLLLGLLGWFSFNRRLGRILAALALVLLWFLSLPAIADLLLSRFELYPPLTGDRLETVGADAIVVLGGGRRLDAPEFANRDGPNARTLERLRYAAWLQRRTGLPLITSGGRLEPAGEPEAVIARRVLEEEFRIPVLTVEQRSRTTWENAVLTRELLDGLGLERVLLVTHAWHMPRAVLAFRSAGVKVVPAPTDFTQPPAATSLLDWLPRADALGRSRLALRELLGMLWYQLQSRDDLPAWLNSRGDAPAYGRRES